MQRSTDRILTTHVGRLQRPEDLTESMSAQPRKRPTDAAFAQRLRDSVAEVVRQQAEAGIDIVNDGEFGKENVIAGTDCGLGYRVHPQIAWAKLKTLSAGARLASKEMWKS